ncbi:MAG: DUF721 domain-containing protein [Alphaproteobacteria bacterium]|nr:DUF721 domain-containing protein [Alphaproteobacteria bacterium]
MSQNKTDFFEKREGRGPQDFSKNLGKIVQKLGGKYGFSEVDLIHNWPVIVGEKFADMALPMRLKFSQKERMGGTLFIRLKSSSLATLMSHQTPIMIEKVNTFFGYQAVAKIQFVH